MEQRGDNFAQTDETFPFPFLYAETFPEVDHAAETSFDVTELIARVKGRAEPTGARDKILVIHNRKRVDPQADRLAAELAKQGAAVSYFHSERFIANDKLEIRLGPNEPATGTLDMPTGTLAFDEIKSVYFRGPEMILTVPPDINPAALNFVTRETEAALFGLSGILADTFWANQPDRINAANNKPGQLRLATALGLRVPRTLITNDPQSAREFYDQCGGEMIVKTLRSPVNPLDNQLSFMYTNRVRAEHLALLERVRHAPCFFQEYVPKDVELRVTIIGKQVFAAEIHSQQSNRGRDDWRRSDPTDAPYYACTLPADTEGACLQLMEHYGLGYGGIDMVRRPDGEYVFLELNPNAEFGWIERLTGQPMFAALARLLINGGND